MALMNSPGRMLGSKVHVRTGLGCRRAAQVVFAVVAEVEHRKTDWAAIDRESFGCSYRLVEEAVVAAVD